MAFTKILPAGISTTGLVTVGSLSVGDVTLTGDTDNLIINTDTVTVRPTLDLNFARDKRLDSKITFTRNSVGTYVDANGLIQTAVNNIPRFDHDPITGESLGLLIEESRTNLHLYSEDLSNWSAETGGSVTTNTHISPDGNQTADTLNGTANGSSAYRIVSLSNATTYTFSVFIKYLSGNENIRIEIGDAPFARSSTTFNTTTGVLVSNTGGTATVNDVVSYGNGWYRYSITRTTTSSGNGFMDINHVSATASSVAVWGAQIEQGSFATSYIPTSGSAVTRAADNAKITGTNFTDFYNQTEGTIFSNFKAFNVGLSDGGRLFRVTIGASSGSNRIDYVVTQDGSYQPYLSSGGTAYYGGASIVGFTTNTDHKISLTIKENDITGYVDGSLSVNDTSFSLFTADSFEIGSYLTGGYLNGHIKSFKYYPKRLSNAQLQNLTK